MKNRKPFFSCPDDDPSARVRRGTAFTELVGQRFSRRDLLKGALVASGTAICPSFSAFARGPVSSSRSSLGFTEVKRGADESIHVPDEYKADVLIRWGDAILQGGGVFDPGRQSAAGQARRFGYNNDFIGFIPIRGERGRALLYVNHEFTQSSLMHPGSIAQKSLNREQVDIDIAAHGGSVIELRKQSGVWKVVWNSRLNRRITPWTPMRFDGPAAGAQRLVTVMSKNGRDTWGTYANCGGGVTPWGTALSAEENVNFYFYGSAKDGIEAENHRRMGIQFDDKPRFNWGRFHDRWHLGKNPREPLHMGWIAEIDPFDPKSVPIKHTALGRFKHEACSLHINRDGRLVAYMGDDQYFEYIYRYVSKQRFRDGDHRHNRRLLSEGQLSVAQFREDGYLQWHLLEYGRGPLNASNGFRSQADVLIDTRKAADLVGATPMDRPEDIEVNPVTGEVYVMLTNNKKRSREQIDPVNPRPENRGGHILTLNAPGSDHTAREYRWDLFLLAGDPNDAAAGCRYPDGISNEGWFFNPDNCCFDAQGRLWIATDGNPKYGASDGVWACDTQGPGRAITRRFLRLPLGAEATGPCFAADHRTFFLSVQHPGDASSFDNPSTRWPDFKANMPPRPAVIAVYRRDGGVIGS